MAAIQVTSANSNSFLLAERVTFRTSAGIPYVLVRQSNTVIQMFKGNSATPTSFSSAAILTAGTIIQGVSGAIASDNIIHISYIDDIAASSDLKYCTFDCNNDTFSSITSIITDIGGDPPGLSFATSIAVNSSNVPHIFFNQYPSVMGRAVISAHYVNKVGGNWNSVIDILVSAVMQSERISIVIGNDDIPCLAHWEENPGSYELWAYRGNTSNPTSFTGKALLYDFGDTFLGVSVVVDYLNNVYVLHGNFDDYLTIKKHNNSDDWSTWQTDVVSMITGDLLSTAIYGTKIYVFYEDSNSNITYAVFDTAANTFGTPEVLETGTFNSVFAKWANYHNHDKDNTETVLAQNTGAGSSVELYEQVGQTFEGSDVRISKVTFKTSRTATPITGNLYARIYEVASLNTAPSGVPIATSLNSFDVSSWTNTATDRTWNFNNVVIESGKYYAVMLHVPGLGSNQRINLFYGYLQNNLSGYKITGTGTDMDDCYIYLYSKPKPDGIDYVFVDETTTPDIWWNRLILSVPASWVTKPLKWYNGSAWVEKPLKYYNGSSWVTKPVKSNL